MYQQPILYNPYIHHNYNQQPHLPFYNASNAPLMNLNSQQQETTHKQKAKVINEQFCNFIHKYVKIILCNIYFVQINYTK